MVILKNQHSAIKKIIEDFQINGYVSYKLLYGGKLDIVGKLIRFLDNAKACFSRVNWESRESAFISIAQVGVLIKRSKMGIFGAKLYAETDINNCLAMSMFLDNNILSKKSLSYLPKNLNDPVLKSFTRLAIETNSAVDFCNRIEEAKRLMLADMKNMAK